MELQNLFEDIREIGFLYNNRHYMISCFNIKKPFRKESVEYWFFPPKDSFEELRKFSTLEDLLNVKIDGHRLYDIWKNVIIDEMY